MPTVLNLLRSNRVDSLLLSYGHKTPDSNLIDLLADVLHWCDAAGECFEVLLAQACRRYVSELNPRSSEEAREP